MAKKDKYIDKSLSARKYDDTNDYEVQNVFEKRRSLEEIRTIMNQQFSRMTVINAFPASYDNIGFHINHK